MGVAMSGKKRLLFLAFLAIFFNLIIILDNSTTSFATSQTDALNESMEGLNDAPNNLGLDSTQFTPGDLSGYNGTKNYAILETAMGRPTAASYDPFRAIRMNTYRDQAGAIWSNVEGGNYVDITKQQTLSLWMYFGPKTHKNSSDGFGDGMAFVLQNSDDGIKAFAHKGTEIGRGESMGVWGIDNDTSVTDPLQIANTAIQKSWALEFDTNSNSSKSSYDDFDYNISGQHIAYGYPGSSNTYIRNTSGLIFKENYFSMLHQGINYIELHDGKWHHLTLTWHPNDFTITYKFNDKNLDGSKGANPLIATTSAVQATEFGGHDALNKIGGKLRWGFVSSNGDAYEANLIAFESIPSEIEGEVSSNIVDQTQNKTIKDDSTDNTVNSGDDLAFNYNLSYKSGSEDWTENVAKIDLPSNVTFSNGIIGYVTYNNATDDKSEPIYASEITTKENSTTQVVTHTLGQGLNDTNKNATITLYGVANTVYANTLVASAHANFSSPNLIQDTDTPEFVIQKSKPINLSLDQSNISVGVGKNANITGVVSYADQTTVNNSDVTVYATLNDDSLDKFTLADSTNVANTTSGKLNFDIPYNKLTQPTNTLKVHVMDKKGNVSTTSTVVITKTGGLALSVDDYSFGSINQATPSMLIPRKGTWNILVEDSRKDGTTSPWKLSASNEGLSNGDTSFKGNVIFKSSSGVITNLFNNDNVPIATGYKQGSGREVTNVGQNWNDSEGIMLKTTGQNTIGNYSGKMDWVLSDTI